MTAEQHRARTQKKLEGLTDSTSSSVLFAPAQSDKTIVVAPASIPCGEIFWCCKKRNVLDKYNGISICDASHFPCVNIRGTNNAGVVNFVRRFLLWNEGEIGDQQTTQIWREANNRALTSAQAASQSQQRAPFRSFITEVIDYRTAVKVAGEPSQGAHCIHYTEKEDEGKFQSFHYHLGKTRAVEPQLWASFIVSCERHRRVDAPDDTRIWEVNVLG